MPRNGSDPVAGSATLLFSETTLSHWKLWALQVAKARRVFTQHGGMLRTSKAIRPIEALRAYRERTRKPDFQALARFAQMNRVQKIMRPYLEALL